MAKGFNGSFATHSPASLAEPPGASTAVGIAVRSDVSFKHLGRDWAVEWLLQLIVVVAFYD